MPLEIDLLSVKDADAIVIRTTQSDLEHVVLIDCGGNKEDAITIVNHLAHYSYRSDKVDLLINTHPHNDHIGGLREVIRRLCVAEVFIHEPDSYRAAIESNKAFYNAERYYEAHDSIKVLGDAISFIDTEGVPRSQPFADTTAPVKLLDGAELTILGPTELYYQQQVQSMKVAERFRKSTDDCEVLDSGNDQCPFNNSSVICLVKHCGVKYLFTADAGPSALHAAREFANGQMQNAFWMQIPHHGSKYNISCDMIEYIAPSIAYVSAAGTHENRPNAAVVRSYKDYQVVDGSCRVFSTHKSRNLWFRTSDVPDRCGYSRLTKTDELDRNGK